ncbi:MAG: hypothetical protein KME32_33610 [Mojavia pulchra JT2-VF2]|uniref:Uncharacterized protein n=1 Tax=Mojavia pulchra JT2-VF2 TaxID=287848 RepID=A0A951Q513_9NOST|nr:hypothetical protein [Mojavia pulchra JT2-VF2]
MAIFKPVLVTEESRGSWGSVNPSVAIRLKIWLFSSPASPASPAFFSDAVRDGCERSVVELSA